MAIHKINYFISYFFLTGNGQQGYGNTTFTLDRPIEDYHQIEELHKLIIEKNQDKAMKSVVILNYQPLKTYKL